MVGLEGWGRDEGEELEEKKWVREIWLAEHQKNGLGWVQRMKQAQVNSGGNFWVRVEEWISHGLAMVPGEAAHPQLIEQGELEKRLDSAGKLE